MGWHDDLADRAAAAGKKAEEFRNGARRKGRMTGLWLLATALVWYVAGPWSLIPATLAAFTTVQRISATLIAVRLEEREARLRPS